MAARPRSNVSGDTTFTKIFVGGLAWETQCDTMRRYFEQFGEIVEAVVITDKHTGRSKGYGFVTFKEPESAMRACQDPTPMIDGRRANCNLASLGVSQRPRPPTPHYAVGRFRPAFATATVASSAYHAPSATSSAAYFHQPVQYAYPYSVYGYSGGYSQESIYPVSYYGLYSGSGSSGGGQQQQQHQHHHQFSPHYTAGPGVYQNLYPYSAQYAQAGQAYTGFAALHYPQVFQYPYTPQYFGSGILSLPASISPATGPIPATIAGPSLSQQPQGTVIPEPKPSA